MNYYLPAAKACPSSHPVAYNDGASCCYFYNRINDTTINPDLDGTPLHYLDPEEYCADHISPSVDTHGQKLKMNKENLGNPEYFTVPTTMNGMQCANSLHFIRLCMKERLCIVTNCNRLCSKAYKSQRW